MANLYHINQNTLKQIADAVRSVGSYSWTFSLPYMINLLRRVPTKLEPDFELNYFQGTLPSVYENSDIAQLPNFIFYNRSELTEVSFAQCINIRSYAFYSCINLQNAYFPNCSSVGTAAFQYNYNLENINLSKCKYLNDYAFYRCSKLKSINLPQCSYIGSKAFYDCISLSVATLFNCSRIDQSAFANNSQLSTIILQGSVPPSLYDSKVFLNTPLDNSLGSIYVPASLVDLYKSSDSWSLYSNIIIGFEEDEIINGRI